MWLMLLLAFGLRLLFIGESLWLDEAIEALALMGKMGPILSYALSDFQPPLYHFLGILVTQLFGYSEISLRLISLVAGVGTVYFVGKLGLLLGNRQVGQISSLLAATNPLLIYYSSEGRTYMLTTFLVTASFYYLLSYLKQPTVVSRTLYAFCLFLFIWTSYLSWFVVVAQALYVLQRKQFRLFLLQLVICASLLFWLPSLVTSLSLGQATLLTSPAWGQIVGALSWKSLPLTWVKFVFGRISFTNKLVYGLLALAVGIFHGLLILSMRRFKSTVLYYWLFPPLVITILLSAFLPIFQYFRVLFLLPGYLLLLAMALGKRPLITIIAALCLQLVAFGYYVVNPRFHKEDWRTLATLVSADPQIVPAMPSQNQNAPLTYYGVGGHVLEPSRDILTGSPIYYIRYAEDLFDGSRVGRANFTHSGYTLTKELSLTGIQVDIYEHSH